MNTTVKNKLIKLAYENPEIRSELLDIVLKTAAKEIDPTTVEEFTDLLKEKGLGKLIDVDIAAPSGKLEKSASSVSELDELKKLKEELKKIENDPSQSARVYTIKNRMETLSYSVLEQRRGAAHLVGTGTLLAPILAGINPMDSGLTTEAQIGLLIATTVGAITAGVISWKAFPETLSALTKVFQKIKS
jgi:hypothetical protein